MKERDNLFRYGIGLPDDVLKKGYYKKRTKDHAAIATIWLATMNQRGFQSGAE